MGGKAAVTIIPERFRHDRDSGKLHLVGLQKGHGAPWYIGEQSDRLEERNAVFSGLPDDPGKGFLRELEQP